MEAIYSKEAIELYNCLKRQLREEKRKIKELNDFFNFDDYYEKLFYFRTSSRKYRMCFSFDSTAEESITESTPSDPTELASKPTISVSQCIADYLRNTVFSNFWNAGKFKLFKRLDRPLYYSYLLDPKIEVLASQYAKGFFKKADADIHSRDAEDIAFLYCYLNKSLSLSHLYHCSLKSLTNDVWTVIPRIYCLTKEGKLFDVESFLQLKQASEEKIRFLKILIRELLDRLGFKITRDLRKKYRTIIRFIFKNMDDQSGAANERFFSKQTFIFSPVFFIHGNKGNNSIFTNSFTG